MTNPAQHNVLLLETNEDIHQIISKMLPAFDLTLKRVTYISDAELALRSLERPSFIILGTGFTHDKILHFVHRIRLLSSLKDIPVILLIDDIDTSKIKAALDAGISRYLATTFLPGNLSNVIRDFGVSSGYV